MTSISDKTMDSIMHILQTVVTLTTTICISSIRKRCVIRGTGDELVCQGMEAGFA